MSVRSGSPFFGSGTAVGFVGKRFARKGSIVRLIAVLCVFFVSASPPLLGDEAGDPPVRTRWQTSRITGSPAPPPPLKQVIRYPNLQFQQPLLLTRDPANRRMWVITRDARVLSFPDQKDVTAADLFVDLRAEFDNLTQHSEATRVNNAYGLAFHPDYPRVPVCWMTYTLVAQGKGHLEDGTRLSRFHVQWDDDGIPRCDIASEKVLLAWPEGGHNGACLKFGPDGCLYISAGDGEVPNPPDPRRAGQDVRNRLSTILRIRVNATGEDPLYTIPPDNPFVRTDESEAADPVDPALQYSGTDALPEIWAYGFRNPWKMNFGPNGQLWVGDVGWELYEMIYNVKPGGNYGWSIVEGPHTVLPDAKRGPTPILPPALAYSHAEGASVTGGFIYQGKRFPELRGQYIFGDYETRRIWAAEVVPGTNGAADRLAQPVDLVEPSVRIVAFGEDTSGELLLVHFDEGTIYELQPNTAADNAAKFPTTLSQTGLRDPQDITRHAAGLIPFRPAVSMWRDTAVADNRVVGIPGDGFIEVLPKVRRRADSSLRERMTFPADSVLAHDLVLTDDSGNDVRLETQVLHFNGHSWYGYSYVWNPGQSDAQLAPPEGQQLDLSRYGRFAERDTWRVHSRSECLRCHNSWAGGPLAFTIPQLAASNGADSVGTQLAELQTTGVLRGDILSNAANLERAYPALTDPDNETAPVADRARSYLSVNCAHCHQRGAGGTATIDLRFAAPLDQTGLVDASPAQGTFQIPAARLVAAGQPWKSVLLYRMACSGRGRMPHLGSEQVDPAAVRLVRQWIRSLEEESPEEPPAPNLHSTSAALQLVQQIDQQHVTGAQLEQITSEALKASPEVRNLFTRFQPLNIRQRLTRTLNPRQILALEGQVDRGAALFANERIQCIKCHRVGSSGGKIGPPLDDVGRRLSRAEILQSILQPSQKIDPRYATWTALTDEGKVVSGLLMQKNENFIVLRTPENKDERIARSNLEELIPQTTSLMPDRLLNDLTDQQIADLLAWLAERTETAIRSD